MIDHSNREDFLNAIAEKAGRPRHQLQDHPFEPLNDLPETTLSGHSQDELEAIAKKNSEAVHVTFSTTDKAGLADALNAYIEHDAPKTLILPTTDQYEDFGLRDWTETVAPKPMYWTPGKGRDFNLKQAAAADVAIGFADYLLAESGTITIATTPGQGRGFHFLPTHYLAIVKKSNILPRSRQAMDRYDAAIKAGELQTSNINFITGPSNSGDIEMTLVVGVHGPLDMTYLVVEDM
ncbi:LutC/YkgG family protein [Lacticaseibacillus zeae]|uniref:Lactate utilization protein C n=1 Tax=Lacticaseibacillus zeae subsp. silagei TaxID=3068307 RepID=A0ABD7Z755_LACZE|nr:MULTISPECIES: lactate utilization protein C [Lacticaseibacillus]MDE3315737.1 lactate utilization protein C [Lacticaseibacillus zeae]OFR91566.1 lactate utilization protein C [Lactobacillus sp. HMSC068F07]WLV82791.1 lactate utilization protein C [Lacticaseibacillus sp. NCIMB 15475]WLV85532.1 lactate utilization protein C [Lacticaseibacillus sp. NCIMB 15474]